MGSAADIANLQMIGTNAVREDWVVPFSELLEAVACVIIPSLGLRVGVGGASFLHEPPSWNEH